MPARGNVPFREAPLPSRQMAVAAAVTSALLLPGFTQYGTGPGGGRLLEGTFPGTFRTGYVYLPPHFDLAVRYPVVYLLHGMPGSPDEFLSGTQLPAFADAAVADGLVRPFIAVMPAAGTRHGYNGEWAGPWERALVDDTIPFVDRHLPTIAAPNGRVIAGLSAGGYGAMDIGLRHIDVFGAVESWGGGVGAPPPPPPRPVSPRRTVRAARERPDAARHFAQGEDRSPWHALLRLERPVAQPLVQGA
jgi:poly(3-hydroxybutyrate) depolymerase